VSSDTADTVDASEETADGDPPRVYRCLNCKAPIADLVIAPACEECGQHIGEDKYLIDSVSTELLEEVSDAREGCITCGADTDQVFCCTDCNEEWFATYTDAYLR